MSPAPENGALTFGTSQVSSYEFHVLGSISRLAVSTITCHIGHMFKHWLNYADPRARKTWTVLFAASCAFVMPDQATAKTYSIRCQYDTSVDGSWPDDPGRPHVRLNTKFNFSFLFTVEVGADTAHMTGNQGASKVTVVWGRSKVTFLETTGDGTVHTTTLYGKEVGVQTSVHSRADGKKGFEVPSQYYGLCKVK